MTRSSKVATPFTAARVKVPRSAPPAALVPRATVTFPVPPTWPFASRSETLAVIASPARPEEGCASNFRVSGFAVDAPVKVVAGKPRPQPARAARAKAASRLIRFTEDLRFANCRVEGFIAALSGYADRG